MSLLIWLPCVRDLNNQGVTSLAPDFTSSNSSIISNGKLGNCLKLNDVGEIDTHCRIDLNTTSVSFGGWYKFNKAELQAVADTKTYTSTNCYLHSNLIGNNSYGGVGLNIRTNNLYTDSGVIKDIVIFSTIRSPSESRTTSFKSVSFDVWYHLYTVWNLDTMTVSLYVNGELFSSSAFTTAPSGVVLRDLFFNYKHIYSGNGFGVSVPCMVNDIRIYNHALSAKEIKLLSQGLVAHYTLGSDRGCENILTNSAGYNGTTNWTGVLSVGNECGNPYFIAQRTNTTTTSRTFVTHASIASLVSSWVAGDKFTISGYYRIPSNETYDVSANMFIRWGTSSGTNDTGFSTPAPATAIKDTWIRFEKTYAIPETYTSGSTVTFYMSAFSQGLSTVHWKYIKLEKGEKATPWMPNPADTQYTTLGYDNTTVYDCSGNNYSGTVLGTLTSNSDTPRYSTSTQFSTDSHINTTLITSGFADSYTFAWWGIYASYTGYMMWGFGNGNRLNLFMSNSGKNFYLNTNDGTANPFGSIKSSDYANAWHHFAITGDGTTSKLYIDGEFKANATTYKPVTGTILYMNGYEASSRYNFNGSLSDFRVYATTLSADDIKELYQVGQSISDDKTLFAYSYDESDNGELLVTTYTSAYVNHSESSPYTNFNSNGEVIFTANSTSMGSPYIPTNPVGTTYYYDMMLSVNTGNNFYLGFERYDKDFTPRSNNACKYVVHVQPSADIVMQRYRGTVDLSTDGVNPCAYIAIRVLNGWSGTTSGVTGESTVHYLSLREVGTEQEFHTSFGKNGIVFTDLMLDKNRIGDIEKTGVTNMKDFVEI